MSVSIGRGVKVWVFVSLCALILWILWMTPSNITHFLNVISGLPDYYSDNPGMFIAEQVGLAARALGVVLALASAFMIWGRRNAKPSPRFESYVEAALFLEGTFFILLFPSGLWQVNNGLNFVGVSLLLRAVSAGSVLMILSFKVRHWSKGGSIFKWVGIAAVGYISALWFNVVFHWFDVISVIGSSSLLRGVASWGFLSSLVTMTLAVFFAGVGAWFLAGKKGESVWWFGLSLIMIGIHSIVYLWYSFSSGNLDQAMQMDIWTVPFLGIGVSLLRMKVKKNLL